MLIAAIEQVWRLEDINLSQRYRFPPLEKGRVRVGVDGGATCRTPEQAAPPSTPIPTFPLSGGRRRRLPSNTKPASSGTSLMMTVFLCSA
jgi:hypothetical protein